MQKTTTTAIALSAALAGAGVGRATVPEHPAPPAPKLARVCVEADGSAQVYTAEANAVRQLLVPPDHKLAVMHREGGKAADSVPAGLSTAIRSLVGEAGKLAASAK
jgi:hypothetical protein